MVLEFLIPKPSKTDKCGRVSLETKHISISLFCAGFYA